MANANVRLRSRVTMPASRNIAASIMPQAMLQLSALPSMIMTSLREADATLTVQVNVRAMMRPKMISEDRSMGSTRLGEVELVSTLAEYPFSSGMADVPILQVRLTSNISWRRSGQGCLDPLTAGHAIAGDAGASEPERLFGGLPPGESPARDCLASNKRRSCG
jgi:hypothetical protein